MESLGAELKKAREARGVAMRDMATRTKISVTALEALERDDFSRLPGGIFGRSFVRAYAIEVGLEPDAIVERFVEGLEKSERDAAERRRAAQPAITLDDQQFLDRQRRALLTLRIGLVVVAIAAVAAIVWGVRVAWPLTADGAASGTTVGGEVTPAPVSSPAPAPVEPTPAVTTDAPSSAPSAVAASIVIDVETTAECQVSVGVDATPQVTRQFRAGERARFEATEQLLIDVTNAGAVRLVINGQPARPLGADGARVRTRITRDNLREYF